MQRGTAGSAFPKAVIEDRARNLTSSDRAAADCGVPLARLPFQGRDSFSRRNQELTMDVVLGLFLLVVALLGLALGVWAIYDANQPKPTLPFVPPGLSQLAGIAFGLIAIAIGLGIGWVAISNLF
jgi:hypothetical protein